VVLAFTSQVHTKKGVPTRNNSVQFVIIIFPGQNLRQFVVPRMRRKSSPTDLDLYRTGMIYLCSGYDASHTIVMIVRCTIHIFTW